MHYQWESNKITILTTGVFDLYMHIGHVMLLQTCRKIAGPSGRVIVGVNTDWSAKQYKRKPFCDQFIRKHCIELLGIVDIVHFINHEADIERIITEEKVDLYVKDEGWADKQVTGSNLTQVIFIPSCEDYYSRKISTSTIIKNVIERHKTDQADHK